MRCWWGCRIKQLFGYERVHLAPGARRTVYFTVNEGTLRMTGTKGEVVAVPGAYGLLFTNGVSEELRTGPVLTNHDAKPLVIQGFAGRA